ncbi:MAG: PaaX family transcriptional regulator C-terminal domain-containing protein [Jatrophihabitantaceae bacterium]
MTAIVCAVASTDGAGNGRGPAPRALIVSVYGLYAREAGGWLSVALLIRLLAELGVDPPAVRSSISRLKRRGILLAERSDGIAGYALSPSARAILDAGDRRIFQRQQADPADGWLLAVFSVPEAERDRRHQLRSRLSGLGFGTVSAGVWIAPARLLAETAEVLARHQLTGYVDLFRAEHLAFAELAEQLPHWWDLARLQGMYGEFLDRHRPRLISYRRRRSVPAGQAFADYLAALTDWRRLPYADPGLAAELLPRDWKGIRAAETFFELRERLAVPAHQHCDELRRSLR